MSQNQSDQVILVDPFDHPLGSAEKIQAHRLGQLHRAFSIFIFYESENQLELLIQKRHSKKYHCGGLWSNTCCSHPRPGESTIKAAARRLHEEIGIQVELKPVGSFQYLAHFDNGLTENEYDHVLVGLVLTRQIAFDPQEIAEIRWVEVQTLVKQLEKHPEEYTPWFRQALAIALKDL